MDWIVWFEPRLLRLLERVGLNCFESWVEAKFLDFEGRPFVFSMSSVLVSTDLKPLSGLNTYV